MPLLDVVTGTALNNPPEGAVQKLDEDNYYQYILYGTAACHYLTPFVGTWAVGTQNLDEVAYAGLALSVGIMNGFAVATAHALERSNLLLFENGKTPGVPLDDVQEVSNYVAAMTAGLGRLRGGFPLSLRVIKELHDVLFAKGRGSKKQPGEFRRSQNWIGGTRPGNALYVSSPPNLVADSVLEPFLEAQSRAVLHAPAAGGCVSTATGRPG